MTSTSDIPLLIILLPAVYINKVATLSAKILTRMQYFCFEQYLSKKSRATWFWDQT